ncbi:MAG TPA: hypothetical protein VFV52_13380 [Bacilli bacterium]|nr:hypothetical protein [Bacilli bacterium]
MPSIRGFYEYRIRAENREDYLQLMQDVARARRTHGFLHYELSEALARKNQFIETFLIPSMEEYRAREAKLLEDPQVRDWLHTIDTYIENGPETKKIWFFAEIDLPETQ